MFCVSALIMYSCEEVRHGLNTSWIEFEHNYCLINAKTAADSAACDRYYEQDMDEENDRHDKAKDTQNEINNCEKFQKSVLQNWGYSDEEAKEGAKTIKKGHSNGRDFSFDCNEAISELIKKGYTDKIGTQVFAEALPKFGLSSSAATNAIKSYYDDELYVDNRNPYQPKDPVSKCFATIRIGNNISVTKELLIEMGLLDEDEGDDEGDDQVVCAIGHQAHEHEATASHRRHHQKRRGTLGESSQPTQGEREDGGEHDGFEEIVAHQGAHGEPSQIAQDEQRADHRAHATDEQHAAGLNTAHDPRTHETSNHEERQGAREHHGGCAVGHPTQARDEVDEIAVDGDLGHLVGEQGEESEDEHFVAPQLPQLLKTSFILGRVVVFDLGQVHTREHHGDSEHYDAQDGVG